MVCSASSVMKIFVVFPSGSRSSVELVCCIVFGSAKVLGVYVNLLL